MRGLPAFGRLFRLFEESTQARWIRWGLWLTFVSWITYCVDQIFHITTPYTDWMLISSGFCFFPGLIYSLSLEDSFRSALNTTITNGAIDFTGSGDELFSRLYAHVIDRYRAYTALVIAVFEFGVWLWFFALSDIVRGEPITISLRGLYIGYSGGGCNPGSCTEPLWRPMALLLAILVCAFLAGSRIGTMIALGGLGNRLRRGRIRFRLMLAHPDNAGGFGALGDFFRHQALILAALTLWLSVWWLLAPSFRGENGSAYYVDWQPGLFALWILSIVFILFSFVVPLQQFRFILRRSKKRQIDELRPQYTARVTSIQSEIAAKARDGTDDSGKTVFSLLKELSDLQVQFERFRNTPSIPIDLYGISRFSGTLFTIVIVPLLAEYIRNGFASASTFGQGLLKLISN